MFKKNNEGFLCINCKMDVPPHPKSSRDHCNFCLYGLHVDITPGDRKNECRGLLKPVGIKIANGKTQIVYRCQKCSQTIYCTIAPDDNKEEIISLSTKSWS